MRNLFLPLAVLALSTATVRAQSMDVRSSWAAVSGNLIAAAAKMPESGYSFRPTPQVRSFAELVGHVAGSQFGFCGQLVTPKSVPDASKLVAKDELLKALKQSVALCTTAADQLTDENAAQAVPMFGRNRARITVLWSNIVHSNEHYGNLVTYLRLQGIVPPSSEGPARARLYFDQAHGQNGPSPDMAEIGQRAGFQVVVDAQPLTAAALKNTRLLYLRAPSKPFTASEKEAVIAFVKGGGSLLLILDEEQRQPLAGTGVNDIIEPFGLKLTPDLPYLHNCGAVAKAGLINAADREIPFSGGRAVEGGTPFAYQLDKDGKPGPAFAAFHRSDNGGRVIVMGEAMASIFLGVPQAVRLSGEPRNVGGTVYWGKDSAIFMEEVFSWLVRP